MIVGDAEHGAGNVTGSSNGNGVTYALSYNTAPRLTQITTNHVSSTVGSGTFISGLQYNAFGEPVSSTLYNGIGESWTYDARGRLSSYSAAVGANTKYSLSNLTYSGNSNVRSATDSVNGAWSSYTYDDFNRLVTSTCTATCPSSQSSLAFSYVYDRYGNRWQQNVTAGSGPQPQYSFDVNNRITASVYTYNAAGNVINDGTHSYTYNAENRIVKWTVALRPSIATMPKDAGLRSPTGQQESSTNICLMELRLLPSFRPEQLLRFDPRSMLQADIWSRRMYPWEPAISSTRTGWARNAPARVSAVQ